MRQPIIFDGSASPVKTALFMIICAAWLLPGLIGHDPNGPDEALAFGVVLGMLRDGYWLVPHIAGTPTSEYPPLYYWSAAATAKLFGGLLPMHDGARLASGLWMALAMIYLHKTATRLFDERAGRISVVLLIGSLGLFLRGHEINPEVAGFAGTAIGLYGLTRMRYEALRGGVTTGIGMGIVALAVGWVPALALPLIAAVMMALLRDWQSQTLRRGVLLSFFLGTGIAASYPLLLLVAASETLTTEFWLRAIIALPWAVAQDRELIDVSYYLRVLPWYALPTLPFALWLWRRDRHKIHERIELALPKAAFIVLLLVTSLWREARDAHAMTMLLPLALAAACALDRLPRGLARFIDWLSLLFCGLLIVAAWLFWAAAVTGVPAAAAGSVARQVPDYRFTLDLFSFSLAAALSIIWIYAVARAHRNNRRAVVNWSAGITLIWVLVNLLMLPAIDHVRSYRSTVARIAAVLPAGRICLQAIQLGNPQRAMLDYFGGIRVVGASESGASRCDWTITQGSRSMSPVIDGDWTLVWQGARPGDNNERLQLYRLTPVT